MSEPVVSLARWKTDQEKADAEKVEALEAITELEGLVIETQDDLEFAADLLAEAKGKAKALKEMQDRVVAPINLALKELKSWFKPGLDALAKYEQGLKAKIAEAHRKKHEEQQKALKAAAAASMAGDTEAAAEAMEAAVVEDFEPVKGLSMSHTWDYEITDFEEIPREYLVTDDSKIKAVIRAHKGEISIPGIKVKRNTSVRSAAR